jgi:hypothetical protein
VCGPEFNSRRGIAPFLGSQRDPTDPVDFSPTSSKTESLHAIHSPGARITNALIVEKAILMSLKWGEHSGQM